MSLQNTVLRAIRNKFIAGLIILIPILITVKALWWLFSYVDGHARPLIRTLAGREIPGSGFALTIAIVLATGVLFSVGPLRRLLDGLVEVAESVPLIGPLYGTIRKVLSGFGSPQTREALQRFVLVRRGGVLSPGFLTGSLSLDTRENGEVKYHSVYLPTNHLYLGDILFFPPEDVILTDIRVEDGISMILSAGSSVPALVRER